LAGFKLLPEKAFAELWIQCEEAMRMFIYATKDTLANKRQ